MSHPTSTAQGHEARFYLGTYTNPTQTGSLVSSGIYVGGIDLETGRLSPLRPAGVAENPSFLALSPDRKFIYAAIEREEGAVAAFRVEADGVLTRINELPTGGAGTCHVAVDSTGRYVFAANYRGASLVAFRAAADGSLEKRTALIPLTGSGPHPQRQTQSFGHSIYIDRSNRFVYGCDLGSDHIWSFKWGASTGTLLSNEPPSSKVPAGSGPRHLAFSAQGNFAYVCNELNSTVTVLALNVENGGMTPLQTISILSEGMEANGFGIAEIVLHPSGHWLYISNRDTKNNGRDFIAVFAIAPDGRLTGIERVSSQVKHPRSFDIDPSGRWLVVAGQADHRIAVLKINQVNGTLEPTDQNAEVPAPVCVLFALQYP